MHSGVYAVHPPPFGRDQRYLAATMTFGPDAYISHEPAAALQGIDAEAASFPVHVTVSGGRIHGRDGIVVHRRAPLDPRDIRRIDGVPCVSADFVLVQLAPHRSEAELEGILVAAESLGLLKRERLAELVGERGGRPGIHKLASLLELEPAIARSGLEVLFLPLWRIAEVPRPRANFLVAVPGRSKPLTVDFAWPRIRMAVEADSQRFHGDWERAEIDRERDQLLALAGWACHRFVRRRIVADRAGCAERLGQLAEARSIELGATG